MLHRQQLFTLIKQRLAILQLTELLKQGHVYPIIAQIYSTSGNDVVLYDGKEVEALGVKMCSFRTIMYSVMPISFFSTLCYGKYALNISS